ncbi:MULTISPECIES: lysophospholipid acyltransferase family protein [Xanthomarina]|uniref:lysophospholipid acyltransferase family protein n=1 Tax=Xanthomarina TaxID=1868329 RepID=UPI000C419720|nr:lysophospholipid acyltransferase family protein [Xanthomarina sp.]MAL22587.1 1-acyl-sn-glycerol-3-phosphate acyltransferase [Xanthomarina sp.]MBF61130.1 1-acyl-sn-glycerol-3-phosphate acyltransferase [Xanthomarina sp.]|tara:strand:- start:860 stop:1597 length:738 start_codon:yes stop_codon:yes gene_type:complete
MQKFVAYILTSIYAVFFLLTLVVFHPIQWFCFNVLGYQAHKKSVDWLQFFIMRCTNILGTRYTFTNPYKVATGQPLIIVSNHQSMYDIPCIIWYMRKHHPKFISKQELGKGIPSVSYNLRHGGSVLIDRKNPRQSLPAIMKFGEYIEKTKRAAVIFPEGTRSKNGQPKPFQTKGLEMLFKKIPSATIVPITINNSWKMLRYGKFPMGIGNHIQLTVHEPLKLSNFEDKQELIKQIEKAIGSSITP